MKLRRLGAARTRADPHGHRGRSIAFAHARTISETEAGEGKGGHTQYRSRSVGDVGGGKRCTRRGVLLLRGSWGTRGIEREDAMEGA